MSRIPAIDPANATGNAKDLLDAVQSKLGLVPNMTRVMANSPVVLESYLTFSGALSHGLLNAKTREQLALAVSQQNQCDYCLSAHSLIGKMAGLTPEQIVSSRNGQSDDARTAAALLFAQQVNQTRGQIQPSDLAAVREAGFSDAEITEILAHVALNVFTNYFNLAAQVDIDFPKVSHTA